MSTPEASDVARPQLTLYHRIYRFAIFHVCDPDRSETVSRHTTQTFYR